MLEDCIKLGVSVELRLCVTLRVSVRLADCVWVIEPLGLGVRVCDGDTDTDCCGRVLVCVGLGEDDRVGLSIWLRLCDSVHV